MIDIIFTFGTDYVFVRVQDSNCFFRTQQSQFYATIDGLKLDKQGVVKEFPELKDETDWKQKAIDKFKEKIKQMKTEKEKADYIIKDLGKFGYKPKYIQFQGHRPIKLN